MLTLSFDILLGVGMLIAAVGALWSRDLFRAVVLFVVFGLLGALAWMRLQAPDVALAEAAIGAGLTGALLLDALGHLRDADSPIPHARRSAAALLSIGVASALLLAVLNREVPSTNLAEQVQAALPMSGVEHAVTAVLLQFRSYDTLLEIAVLLVAAIIALALRDGPTPTRPALPSDSPIQTPLLTSLVRLLLPVMIVTAVYLLWAGAFQPGGAFQAGAVLAALGVIWRISGGRLPTTLFTRWGHASLIGGFATFLVLASAMLWLGRPLLAWPSPAAAHVIIVVIEVALTVSIGAGLLALFVSAPSAASSPPSAEPAPPSAPDPGASA
jgi:multisubunit Na+/H+ antiporter MnhB subunit